MEKDNLLKIIRSNPSNYWKIIKCTDIDFYNSICLTEGDSFSEKLYRHINDISVRPVCNHCKSKLTNFINITDGYYKVCSKSCASKSNLKVAVEASKSEACKVKRKSTFISKYNVYSPLQLKSCIDNRNKSLDELFGGNPFMSQKVRDKIKESKRNSFISDCLNGVRLQNITPNFDHETFTSINDRFTFKCNSCGDEFSTHLKWGSTPICKQCHPKSSFEREVDDYIKSIYIGKIDRGNKTLLSPYELDFYMPDINLAIECDGLYWHGENSSGKSKDYHINKTNKCNSLGIRLVHIFEDEWIYKKDIVKSKISSLLKLDNIKYVGARVTKIKHIPSNEASEFLTKNHIQGNCNSPIKLGAFIDNELVSVVTFGKERISMGNKSNDKTYELVRFSNKIGYSIKGILQKFIKTLRNNVLVNKIVTYSDNRWSNEETVYKKIGFELINLGKPNYWYIIGDKRFHRYNFRKSELDRKLKLFDVRLSEWENMKINKYDRIWDCGSCRWELDISTQ